MRVEWLEPILPFGQGVFIALMLVCLGVATIFVRDKQRLLLAAGIMTAAWQGGMWLTIVNNDIRIVHVIFAALFAMQVAVPRKRVHFKQKHLRVTYAWGMVILWSLLAVTQAINADHARGGPFLFIIDLLMFFVIIRSVQTPDDLRFLVRCVAGAVIFQALLALWQFKVPFFKLGVIDTGSTWMWWRARGTPYHPNHLGMIMAFTLPVILRGLIAGLARRDRLDSAILGAAFILGGGALLTTYNRGSWVGLAAGLFFMICLDLMGRGGKLKRIAMGLAVAGALVVGVGGIKYGNLVINRLFYDDASEMKEGRDLQSAEAIELIKQKPILGVGYANDHFYATQIFVHNVYLLVGTEIGAVGFLFFLWFMAEFLILMLQGARSRIPLVTNYSRGFVASIIAFLIASIPGPDFWINVGVQMHFFFILAILVSARRIEGKLLEVKKMQRRKQAGEKKQRRPQVESTAEFLKRLQIQSFYL